MGAEKLHCTRCVCDLSASTFTLVVAVLIAWAREWLLVLLGRRVAVPHMQRVRIVADIPYQKHITVGGQVIETGFGTIRTGTCYPVWRRDKVAAVVWIRPRTRKNPYYTKEEFFPAVERAFRRLYPDIEPAMFMARIESVMLLPTYQVQA